MNYETIIRVLRPYCYFQEHKPFEASLSIWRLHLILMSKRIIITYFKYVIPLNDGLEQNALKIFNNKTITTKGPTFQLHQTVYTVKT